MIYNFKCVSCSLREQITQSIHEEIGDLVCVQCSEPGMPVPMQRDWQADAPQLNTQACRDHDHIPHEARVARPNQFLDPDRGHEVREERRFQQHITKRRAELADGGNRGGFRHTHSVPADLFHGKIRETGDKQYWDDPKNLDRHKSTEVS